MGGLEVYREKLPLLNIDECIVILESEARCHLKTLLCHDMPKENNIVRVQSNFTIDK